MTTTNDTPTTTSLQATQGLAMLINTLPNRHELLSAEVPATGDLTDEVLTSAIESAVRKFFAAADVEYLAFLESVLGGSVDTVNFKVITQYYLMGAFNAADARE